MPNTASPREEQSSKCWRPPASRALSRLDDTQRPARTHEPLQFRGNEHELTACSGEIRRCPRSRYQSAPGAKSSYRNRRVRGPFWCNPITLLDPRQPALTVGVRGPPGPAARVSQRGSTCERIQCSGPTSPVSVSIAKGYRTLARSGHECCVSIGGAMVRVGSGRLCSCARLRSPIG
jgi:hypothetical protein